MKQDLFIKKQFEMVKIVYSIVVIEILILVASLPAPDPLKLMLQNLSLFSKAPGGGGGRTPHMKGVGMLVVSLRV